MLISVPPHLSILKVVQYIKGKSSRKLQGELQELRKRCQGHTYGRNDILSQHPDR
ncbi:MAG: transposase [Alphaproteobacteria bacterium]|nr:transposase [Alphaproteobacteria bacterium]